MSNFSKEYTVVSPTLSGLTVIGISQPAGERTITSVSTGNLSSYPRTLQLYFWVSAAVAGTVKFTGLDQDGVLVDETFTFTAGGPRTVIGNVAFSTITQYVTNFGSSVMIWVSYTDTFGLPTKPGGVLKAVFKHSRVLLSAPAHATIGYPTYNSGSTIGTVNTTYRTVSLTSTGGEGYTVTNTKNNVSFMWYYTYE